MLVMPSTRAFRNIWWIYIQFYMHGNQDSKSFWKAIERPKLWENETKSRLELQTGEANGAILVFQ